MTNVYAIGGIVLVLSLAAAIRLILSQRRKLDKLRSRHQFVAVALKESELRYAAMLDAFPDLMFIMDEEGTYLDWHARDAADLYVPPQEFLGKKMRDIMPRDLADQFSEGLRQASLSDKPVSIEYSLTLGERIQFFETRIVKCGAGRLLSIVRNVSDRKQVELELRKLSSRIMALQDEERRRIARELHDVTAQNLFAITVSLQHLRQTENGLTSTGHEIFGECLAQCEQSLREVRTLSYVLHPPGLDHLGLIPALQWYVDGFAKRSGIAIMLTADQDMGRLLPDMERDVFRIVQEGLSNVFRHSGSVSANVVIQKHGNQLIVEIRDQGKGMPQSDNEGDTEISSRLGVGLLSIRERLHRFGGRLDIQSAENGVALVAKVPVCLREKQRA